MAIVPAMLPMVDNAEIDPAVLPLCAVWVATSRMAIGETADRRSVGTKKSERLAISGLSGPVSPVFRGGQRHRWRD